MKPEVHKLRVNVKSLAAEAKFIREEIRKAHTQDAKNALSCHRTQRVKPEARLAHLALAFVRGVPYKTIETRTKDAPVAKELVNKLQRFTWVKDAEQVVRNWLAAT